MTPRPCAACLTPSEGTYCATCLSWHRLGAALDLWAAPRRHDARDVALHRIERRLRAIEDCLTEAGALL
ncbi:MAG: hypothetical protein ACYC9Z_10110 [Casimicrobiaceae bacterium]